MKIDPAELNKKGLHELFMSAIIPRPIAFVSTVGKDGVFNLAAFSCFAPLCLNPAIVALGIMWKRDGQKKDTLRNIQFSKDFRFWMPVNSLSTETAQASITSE